MLRFLTVCSLVLAFAVPAQADNYGGVSSRYRARMIQLIHHYFDHTGYGTTMVRCADRESGFNPRAVNWAGPVFGLLQIKWPMWAHRGESEHHFQVRMSNPWRNLELGVLIMRSSVRHHQSPLQAWGGSC